MGLQVVFIAMFRIAYIRFLLSYYQTITTMLKICFYIKNPFVYVGIVEYLLYLYIKKMRELQG